MSRFGSLDKRNKTPPAKDSPPAVAEEPGVEGDKAAANPKRGPAARAKAREGKKPVIGYFSEGLSRELRMLSIQENTTMQALMGEAFDLLMTERGRNRFNER